MIRLAVLVMTLSPTLASAQAVSVRGGEHGSFTRLVLDLPAGTDWTLRPERGGGGYTVILDGKTWPVDVARSFDRIDRDRIAALEAGAGRLRIDLACDCSASAFLLGERMLVVDVAAADPNEDLQLDGRSSRSSLEKNPEPVRVLAGPATQDGLLPPLHWLEAARPSPVVDAHATELIARIDRAVWEGLLLRAPATGGGPLPPAQDDLPAPTSGFERQTSPQLRKLGFEDRDGRLSIGGRRCVPDAELAIADWSGGGPASDAMAATRGALLAEFDAVDEAAVTGHARQLLNLGFGAEARAVLTSFGEADRDALIALSFLVDGDPDPSDAFAGQTGCPGSAALWALLSEAGAQPGQSLNTNAAMQAFEALPDHLKSHLAPRVAERFDEMGDRIAARSVLRRTERALGEETAGVALVAARLDAAEGDTAAAAGRLASLIAEPGPETAAALVAAVDVALDENRPVPRAVVEMTAALAVERRHDQDGPYLWRAHLQSLILTGDFDAAFASIAEASQVPAAIKESIAEEAVMALVRSAADTVFFRHALSPMTEAAVARPEIGRAMVTRLLDAGLAEPALDILGRFPELAREDRLLSGRAWLELSRPEQAETQLIGLQGPDADALRAQIRSAMGDHEYAALTFAELGDAEAASRARWLAGSWEDVAREGDGALSRAASLLADAEMAEAGPELSAAERLTEDASRARDVLQALLEETRIAEE